jgi:dTDP-4-dehydrorhamnose 3,5-epimerase
MIESKIDGLKIVPLRRIPDDRGTVMHMLKCTDEHFIQFGEIYFSSVYPGVVKGWHKHREMTLNYACVAGNAKIVVYDERDHSRTKGVLQEIFFGRDNYVLVQVPPDTWNGFTAVGTGEALIANCCTHAHDSKRSSRLDPWKNHIPYSWAVVSH